MFKTFLSSKVRPGIICICVRIAGFASSSTFFIRNFLISSESPGTKYENYVTVSGCIVLICAFLVKVLKKSVGFNQNKYKQQAFLNADATIDLI